MKNVRRNYPLLLAVLVLGCSAKEAGVETAPRPVRTVRVERQGGSTVRTLAGTAHAGIESRLSFRVPGTVAEIRVDPGDRVAKGSVLARLDPTDYELKVGEAEAGLAQAQAGLRQAEADYERGRALYENNNMSRRELDAARARAESAEAQVDSLTKRLAQARRQVEYTVLRAPLAGAIASVDIEVNENVQAGREAVLLNAGSRPEVEVAVPESMIDRIKPGQTVSVHFDAIPRQSFSATVSEVGIANIGGASTFRVVCRLDEENDGIRAGLAADVRFELAAREGQAGIRVPGVAVGEDRQGHFVFVIEGEAGARVARRRAVTPGLFDGEIEILDGLREGELIATAGVRRLVDGMQVRLLDDAGAAR